MRSPRCAWRSSPRRATWSGGVRSTAFDCLTAEDATEATRLMEENFVHAIFCDHRMPGMSGVEFLSEVRDRWPETVRIIITGYTETNDMIAAINEAGIYQLITKP